MRGLPVNFHGRRPYSFRADCHAPNTSAASLRTRWAVCMGRPAKKSGLPFARMTASSARYDRTLRTFTRGYFACMRRISSKTAFSLAVRASRSHPV